MIAKKKWSSLTADEKLDSLHADMKATESNTRSLKKIVSGLMAKVNDIRRYMGMKQTT